MTQDDNLTAGNWQHWQLAPPLKSETAAPPPMLGMFAHNSVPVTIICAPAGFGKSRVLARLYSEWRTHSRPRAWFDCDRQTPADLAAALAQGFGDLAMLVVDGADRLPPPGIAALVSWAIAGRTKLFLAVRTMGGLRLARHLATGDAQVLPPDLLLLRRGHLAGSGDGRLSASQVSLIERLAEGWAAPTFLLARHFTRGGLFDAQGIWLGESHVAGFIAEEVFAEISPGAQRCLVCLSLADEFDSALIDRLWPEGDLTIAGLRDRLGPLMLPGVRAGDWRFNRLLRQHLQGDFARLGRTAHNAVRAVVTNWAADRGDVVAAGTIALQAGDTAAFCKLVTDAGGVTQWQNKSYEHVRQLVKIADDAQIAGDARFQLLRCVAFLKEGRVAEADALYESVLPCLPDTPDARRDAALLQVALLVYGCRAPSQHDEPAFLLLENFALDDGWKTTLPTIRAIHHSQQADFDAAMRAIADAENQAKYVDYNHMFLDMHRAEVSLAQGDLATARKALLRARSRWRKDYPHDKGAETVLCALMAQLEFESGNLRNAAMQLRRSASRQPQTEAWLDVYVAGLEPMFRIAAEQQGIAATMTAIDRLCHQLSRQGLGRIARILLGLRIMLEGEAWLRSGDTIAPRSLIEATPVRAGSEMVSWQEREFATLACAYVDIAAGALQAAVQRLADLIDFARARNLRRSLLRALLLRSAVFALAEDKALAAADFAHALKLGEATGLRRAFAEFGGRNTIDQLAGLHPSGFAQGLARRPRPDAPSAQRPLTSRENQILHALRAGKSDKAIGRDLGITEHGVRFHLKNLYAKLGVHDRMTAVAKAGLPT